MIIRYKLNSDGQVVRQIVHRSRLPREEVRPDRHFSATILKALYQVECEQGSRFRSGFTKSQLKRVHETALARYDETGVES